MKHKYCCSTVQEHNTYSVIYQGKASSNYVTILTRDSRLMCVAGKLVHSTVTISYIMPWLGDF